MKKNDWRHLVVNGLGLLALLLVAFNASSQNKTPQLEINGFVRNYTGVLVQNGDFSILQNSLDLTLKHKREKISFLANPFYYQYPGKEDYFDFRELYLDVFTKKVDIRLGKQQIVWGQADGVFITDIVSPLNLTEFLLWDFNEIRQGVTAVKTKYYPHQDHDLELVWIPVFRPAILPAQGSIWRPQPTFPAPPAFDFSQQDVPAQLKNGELFLRYSLSKPAIDLQLIAASTWEDLPTSHVQKIVDSTQGLTGLTITPEHHRLTVGGANFSTMLGDFILRGEAAWYHGRHFQTQEPMAIDGLVQKDYLQYVAGLDRSLGNWKLSAQFIQKVIFDYEEALAEEQVENLVTLMVNRTLMHDQLRLELFSYLGLNNQDAFIRLRGYYFPFDGLGIELGSNIFLGEQGQFGQYRDNSMIYTRVKYSF